ncbi:unnamed protein product [Polarella glacialis]|uniref:Uncharacterized protein n=1 Tax=Polarella glacialis TaxID=89957 RepID=A0A813DR90_POLGL|nr:unnamed protein product [Polarella glacialis]
MAPTVLGLSESTSTYVIWFIRALLPVLLFCIWYSTQPSEGSKKNRYAKDQLLKVREVLIASGEARKPPPALKGVRVDSALRSDFSQDASPLNGRAPRGQKQNPVTEKASPPAAPAAPAAAAAAAAAAELDSSSEALLNFAAFRHKERPQAHFLMEGSPPPPPRRPPPSRTQVNDSDASKANREAQLVLKGLTNKKFSLSCVGVAKDLHTQLVTSNVSVAKATLTLMVQACVDAGDGKNASNFLFKMESSGHTADSQLLDQVMELHVATGSDAAALGSRRKIEVGFPGGGSQERSFFHAPGEDLWEMLSPAMSVGPSGSSVRQTADAPWNKARGSSLTPWGSTEGPAVDDEW